MEFLPTSNSSRHGADQRGLCIKRLPIRSSDSNLREGLFHEYKKHGKITSVVIRGQGEDRYCIITFKRNEDATRALEVSREKVFFGAAISAFLHEGVEVEDPDLCPPEHALDEYHPKATKTLFVGNLCSNTITQDELRKIFRVYGEIIEIDIKVQANQPGTSYAFVQYSDIKSVVRALSSQETARVGGKSVKLGFGKSQPTNVVWLDNLPTVTENYLTRQFSRYGHLTHCVLDRKSSRALLYFDTVDMAQRALNETRNRALLGRKVQLDYAGYECQVAFMRRLGKNESLDHAYDDYRYYGEPMKDIQSDELDVPYRRRSSTRVKGDELEAIRDRPHSTKSNGSGGRQRPYEFALESSVSPKSCSKSSRDRYGQSSCKEEDTYREDIPLRRSTQTKTSRSDAKWRSHQLGSNSTSLDAPHRSTSTKITTHNTSHYYDETDDVSSDSLSPDLDYTEGCSDSSPTRLESRKMIQPPHSLSSNRSRMSVDTFSPKSGRQPNHKSSSRENHLSDSRKTTASVEPSSPSSSAFHPKEHPRRCRPNAGESPDQPRRIQRRLACVPSYDHSKELSLHLIKTAELHNVASSSKERQLECPRTCFGSDLTTEESTCGYHNRNSSGSHHSQSFTSPLTPTPGDQEESQDTLTKLELERAKLLRELSLLNNEVVVGSKLKTPNKKRELPTTTSDIRSPKLRRVDQLHSHDLSRLSGSDHSFNQSTAESPDEHIFESNTEIVDHISSINKRSINSLASPVQTCISTTTSYTPVDRPIQSYGRQNQNSSSDPVNPLVMDSALSSPKLIIPPEPSSPLTALSSGSPTTTNKTKSNTHEEFFPSNLSTDVTLSHNLDLSPLQNLSATSPPFRSGSSVTNRDPRLNVYVGESSLDIPPPPPPPPVCLKLPLWVDTSRSEYRIATKPATVTSVPNPSVCSTPGTRRRVPNVSELDGHVRKENGCSVDERIRLLDAQLLKSEKARPTMDYSKFRIKRRSEAVSAITPDTCMTTGSNISLTPIGSGSELCPASPSYSTLCRTKVDRINVPDIIVSSVSLSSSMTIPSSPISVMSTSPSQVPRLAETSEFVKSMLSSSKSAQITESSQSLDINPGLRISHQINATANPTYSRPICETRAPILYSPPLTASTVQCRPFISNACSHTGERIQPIGVATRLPSTPLTVEFPVLPRDRLTATGDFLTKSVIKSDSFFTGQDSVHTNDPVTKPSQSYKKSTNELRERPLELNVKHTSNTRKKSTESSDHQSLWESSKSNKNKSRALKVNTGQEYKPPRSDMARPALDDSIFRTSFKGTAVKKEKMGLKLLDGSSLLGVRKKQLAMKSTTSRSQVTDAENVRRESGDNEVEKSSTMKKKVVKRAADVSKTSPLSGHQSTQKPPKQGAMTKNAPGPKASTVSLMKPESASGAMKQGKKRINRTIKCNKTRKLLLELASMETGYESMYDKIKRRASKGNTSGVMDELSDTNNSRSEKKFMTRKKGDIADRGSMSDSDTDECLSEASGSDVHEEIPYEVHTKRILSSQSPELIHRKAHSVCPKADGRHQSPVAAESGQGVKSVDDVKTESESVHRKRHASAISLKSRKLKRASLSGSSNTEKERPDSPEPNLSTKSTMRGSKRGNHSQGKAVAVKCPSTLSNQDKRSSTSSLSDEQRRSIVRKVFASTDSDTSSSSDSETERSRVAKSKSKTASNLPNKQIHQSTSSDAHSSPRISRSCSPDDLDADAAVRHTFGAFALPICGLGSKEKKVDAIPKCTSSPNTLLSIKSPIELVSSKHTPPTLPMLDSSSSTDNFGSSRNRSRLRDAADWNIFTSLSNSTPKLDGLCVLSSKSIPNGINGVSVLERARKTPSNSDDDDNLPSLEKHEEDDDAIQMDGNSVLLDDNSGFLERTGHVPMRNEDLPPPVVSVIDDFSGSALCESDNLEQHCDIVQTDVIEEVVYDTLEIPVTSEQTLSSSIETKLDMDAEHVLTASKAETEQSTNEFQFLHIASKIDQGSVYPIPTAELTASNIPIPQPAAPLETAIGPCVTLSPATMITPSSDADAVGQPVLVTIPNPGTTVAFASPSLTLLPTALPTVHGPESVTSGQQHVALLLPATSVSMNSSMLSAQNVPNSAIYTAPSLVYNPIPNTGEITPLHILPSQPVVTSVQVRIDEPDKSETSCAQAIRLPVSIETTTVDPVTTTHVNPISVPSYTNVLPSTTSHSDPNPSDLTSYVQRVIERVKQEKDEEVLHQRERSKRPKRTPTMLTSPTTVTVCVASAPPHSTQSATLCTPVPTAQLTTSTPTLVNSDSLVGTKTAVAISVDSFSADVPYEVSHVKPDPNDVQSNLTDSPRLCLSDNQNLRTSNQTTTPVNSQLESVCDAAEQIEHETKLESTTVPNTVDEVIDSVVSGDFNETDYLRKLFKGSNEQNPSFGSPVVPSPDHLAEIVSTYSPRCIGSGTEQVVRAKRDGPISACRDEFVTKCANDADVPPSKVITPMHVLTLVATGAASNGQQPLPTATAISPGLINHSNSLSPSVTNNQSAATAGFSSTVPQYYTALPSNDPIVSPSPGADIKDLTAHVTIPLRNYFYSLLATHQLKPSANTPLVPTDSENKSVEEDRRICSPLPIHATLQGSGAPAHGMNHSVDFLAAVATMAAMASPPRAGSVSSDLSLPVSRSAVVPDMVSPRDTYTIQQWATSQFASQTYPIAWQGRLSLKNEEVFVNMHHLSGSRDLLKDCMTIVAEQNPVSTNLESALTQPLKIVQRMRLEPSQLDGVHRKLRQVNDYCMCLTVASTPPMTPEASIVCERVRMNQILCEGFIKYLVDKCAAGIINVCHPSTQQNLYVIHIFPPCEFTRSQLNGRDPTLVNQLAESSIPYLLIVVTTV